MAAMRHYVDASVREPKYFTIDPSDTIYIEVDFSKCYHDAFWERVIFEEISMVSTLSALTLFQSAIDAAPYKRFEIMVRNSTGVTPNQYKVSVTAQWDDSALTGLIAAWEIDFYIVLRET